MTLRERRPWLAAAAAVLAAAGAPASALPGGEGGPSTSLRLWTAPEASRLRAASPYRPGATLAGLGRDANRAEGVLRLGWRGAVVEGSLRTVTDAGGDTDAEALLTEAYQELDAGGLHLTVGQKVTSWDVAFGFRPLDVVQQERRLGLRPFALQGIPQLAWEWFDERWAVTVLWANPSRGRALLPAHDESAAARLFGRLGPVDLHVVSRWSERTGPQLGVGGAVVAGEALELHGSVRWQHRGEHLAGPASGPDGSPLAAAPPGPPQERHDEVAGVVGFTLTPGLELSFLGEAWLDPGGDSPATWRRRRRLASAQRALGDAGAAPAGAAAGNLAWGLHAFDRQSLLRQNLLLRVARGQGRYQASADVLCTPEDRGWVVTLAAARQGERLRLESGARFLGGPPGAAYHLAPAWAAFYVAAEVRY